MSHGTHNTPPSPTATTTATATPITATTTEIVRINTLSSDVRY